MAKSRTDVVDDGLPSVVYRLVQRVDNLSLRLLDVGVVAVAWLLAYIAGYETRTATGLEPVTLAFLVLPVAIQLAVNRVAGLYGPVWRYASVEEAARVAGAVAGGGFASTVTLFSLAVATGNQFPLFTAPPVAVLLMLLGCGGIRFQSRLFALERQQTRARHPAAARALIVGAGGAGATLAYELSHTDAGHGLHLVGFADDDVDLAGRTLRGLPVLGTTEELNRLCDAHSIERILIALPDTSTDDAKAVIERALRTNARVKVLAPASDRVDGPLVRSVRDLDLSDLLGRAHAPVDSTEIAEYLAGATVLITGAGGSIGSEIARQVIQYGPGRVILLDRDETLLHEAVLALPHDVEAMLIDIRDRGRVWDLFERHRPDVVFHAAAQKHVPILEHHPGEAVRTNVLGTWWLAYTAAEHGCRHFVHVSTDKAADPCSVMGATKRLAEQVIFEVGRRYELPFVAVRFGNVLGSRGSVVPTFLRQILEGGPITVTSPDMTRYFMTIPEAVSLVLQSGAMAAEKRILLLDMGEPVSILALARQMIRLAGLRPDDDIEILFTGSRPGERLHERLHDEAEVIQPSVHPSISCLDPKATWEWTKLLACMTQLEDGCDLVGDQPVALLLEEMLQSKGVDCQLGVGRRHELIDLTAPTPVSAGAASSVIDLREGRSNGSGSRRPAVLGGSPAFAPGLPFARPARPPLERVVERVQPSYDSGMLTNGTLVRTLEERVAARLGVAHVVAVSSCTSGLMLAVQALVEARPGPVVLPSFTFSASAHAVAWNGREPRFIDNDRATFQLDTDRAAEALVGASALMATHVFGAPCDPLEVERVARDAGVPLLFDAAHGLGATCDRRPVGTFGDAEVFSLTPTKVLVAGEGGLVATNDAELAARLRVGRDYGNPGDYDTRFVGLNARMSEFHAAMALESLEILDDSLRRRRQLASRYRRGIDGIPGIRYQAIALADESTFKDFTVAVDPQVLGLTRDQLVGALALEGIDTRNYFDPPVHRQQAYRHLELPELPVADETSEGVVSLPIYPDLADDDVDRVVEVLSLLHRHAEAVAEELASPETSSDHPGSLSRAGVR